MFMKIRHWSHPRCNFGTKTTLFDEFYLMLFTAALIEITKPFVITENGSCCSRKLNYQFCNNLEKVVIEALDSWQSQFFIKWRVGPSHKVERWEGTESIELRAFKGKWRSDRVFFSASIPVSRCCKMKSQFRNKSSCVKLEFQVRLFSDQLLSQN